jgi:hypothetical protein
MGASNTPAGFKDPAETEDFEDYPTDDYYFIAELPHVSKELDTEDKNFEQE